MSKHHPLFICPKPGFFLMEAEMTTQQFTAERDYRLSMSIISAMLNNGLLTKREYKKIDTIMTKKYKPILGNYQRETT